MKTRRIKAIFAALAVMAVATVAAAVRVSGTVDGAPCPDAVGRPDLAPPGGHAVEICGALSVRAPDGTRLPRIDGPVAALGDSFTYGYGVEAAESWPTLMGATSYAVPGHGPRDTAEMARSVDWSRHELAVYGVYANDMCPDGQCWHEWAAVTRRAAYVDELRGVRAAIPTPAYAIVIETPEHRTRLVTWAQERALREAGFVVIERELPAGETWSLAPNEHHMNAAGHRWYADRITRAIEGG